MIENWKKIKGYSNYEVSNLGRVKSLRFGKEKIMKPSLQNMSNGYKRQRVNLFKDKVPKMFKVHRLVAQCFIPNPENKKEVNHIDNNPLNNRVENLEWVTRSENSAWCKKQKRSNYGERNGQSKLTEKKAFFIKNSILPTKELVLKFNISKTTVNCIKRGKLWSHI